MNSTTPIENDATTAMKRASHRIDRGVDSTVESLATGFKTVVADAEELLRATASYSGEGFVAAREKFKEKLEVAKSKLVDAQSIVTDKADQAAAVTEKYVAENPWKAIAIVGSVGVIIGMLVSRR
jgi:ElaB/YqjD/DUF883 family membrane-anchored ribosome-binding protein